MKKMYVLMIGMGKWSISANNIKCSGKELFGSWKGDAQYGYDYEQNF